MLWGSFSFVAKLSGRLLPYFGGIYFSWDVPEYFVLQKLTGIMNQSELKKRVVWFWIFYFAFEDWDNSFLREDGYNWNNLEYWTRQNKKRKDDDIEER